MALNQRMFFRMLVKKEKKKSKTGKSLKFNGVLFATALFLFLFDLFYGTERA